MAVYNEIGIGRWNRFIQKLTDMKGSPPARQLSSEIAFSHLIASGQENRYLEGWDRFGIGISNGPIAAQQSGVRLTNPSNSNVIAVMEKITVEVTTSEVVNIEYGRVGATLSNVALAIPMETRGRSAATCIPSFNAAAITTMSVVEQFTPTQNVLEEIIADTIHEISLPPGASVQVDGNTVNTQIFVSFWWRERFLEPAERF
jgi:hypothetical protein